MGMSTAEITIECGEKRDPETLEAVVLGLTLTEIGAMNGEEKEPVTAHALKPTGDLMHSLSLKQQQSGTLFSPDVITSKCISLFTAMVR